MTHDPRIVAIAKDPRTLNVLPSIIISGGGDSFVGKLRDVLPFSQALVEHGLRFGHEPMRELLAYVRSVATEVAETEDERARALAVLRADLEACREMQAAALVVTTDTLVDAGLLTPDDPPDPLAITPLGRAVLEVLERR